MFEPLVSIIMPAYNVENYIKKAIVSILNQSYGNFELLIGDDASSDGTKNIVKSFNDSRIKVFHNETNLGNLKTCNKLFALATGDFIAIQDADDWSAENRIEKQLACFKKDPSLGACCTQCVRVDEYGEFLSRTNYPSSSEEIRNGLPNVFAWHPTSIMLKKEVYEKIGGYPLYFEKRGGADWYWGALIVDYFKLINLNDYLFFYRMNPNSWTHSMSNGEKLYTEELIKFLINQRRLTGSDALENNNVAELELFELKLRSNPVFLDKHFIFYYLKNKEYLKSINALGRILMHEPFQEIKFFKDLLYYIKNY